MESETPFLLLLTFAKYDNPKHNTEMAAVKKFLYKSLSMENYLRLLQRSYFFLYNCGVLRFSEKYACHYSIKKFIKPGDHILDIGANLGYYSILFAKWAGTAGRVHAIEPIPVYNKIFTEKSRKFNNITLYPYALGTENKQVEMVMPLTGGYLHTGLPHVSDPQCNSGEALRFEASMKNPNELFSDLARLDYVKCDVEGYEYEILKTMENIIAKFRPIVQVEIWGQNESKMLDLFSEMQYGAFRIRRNGTLIPLEEAPEKGDVIFIPNENSQLNMK